MIPASLQYPENPLNISRCWVQLSEELFGELSTALNAAAPPDAAVLLAEFEEWQRFEPVPGPNVVDKATVASWLEAYAVALEQRETAKDAYTSSAARLLRGGGTMAAVPFVVAWQNKSSARVLRLETVSVSGGAGGFWLHPSFAHWRADMQAETGQFLAAIADAWASACLQCPQPVAVDVFWRLTTDDGGTLPALQLDGPSASAAAFRAFWHIARDLQIDPDVYVVADATSSDGCIETVGQLREKVDCIQAAQLSRNACPPTLVAAQRLSDDDLAAFRGASTWAEVIQVATVEELVAVRSVTANVARDYLTHLAELWDKTPWYRNGVQVRLSEVHITPHVWKPKPGFPLLSDAASAGGRPEERDWRPAGYDSAVADREVGPRLERTRIQERVPWHETIRNNERITIIAGGPGSGKTSVLQWTARLVAFLGLDEIEKRTTDPDDMSVSALFDGTTSAVIDGRGCVEMVRSAPFPVSLPKGVLWTGNRKRSVTLLSLG